MSKLKFKRKPRFGVWRTGYSYPNYPLHINKIVIRYPDNWFGVERKVREIEKMINQKEKS